MTSDNTLKADHLILWLVPWLEDNVNAKDDYNEMDNKIGDGDFGTHLAHLSSAILESKVLEDAHSASDMLQAMANTALEHASSASGTLYAGAFLEMAKAVENQNNLGKALLSGGKAIQSSGGAKLGEKTMLDVWLPASNDLIEDRLTNEAINTYLNNVIRMEAKHGQNAMYEKDTIGKMDPGAFATAEMFKYILASKN